MRKRKNCELKKLAPESAIRSNRRRQPPLQKCPHLCPYPNPKVIRTVRQEDPFDRLSDDVIVFDILSRLSLRDIVKTSVLSHRWNKLWIRGIGSNLLFSFPKSDLSGKNYVSRLRPVLRRGINHILDLINKQPPLKLDELIIRFNFNPIDCHPDVDKWVQIALSNNVSRLVLNFQRSAREVRYTFPSADKLLAWHANDNAVGGASVNNLSGLYNLKDVCLKWIKVSGEAIECMMSNCPSLERLALLETKLKGNVRVCTKFSKLKTLEIFGCDCIDTITISSASLVSFQYDGLEEVLQLEYVPLLSQLSIAGEYCESFLENGARFYTPYISQLKSLKLSLDYRLIMDVDDTIYFRLEYPKFRNLKQLEVDLSADDCSSYLWLINLIMAAPSLLRFSVQLHPQLFNNDSDVDSDDDSGDSDDSSHDSDDSSDGSDDSDVDSDDSDDSSDDSDDSSDDNDDSDDSSDDSSDDNDDSDDSEPDEDNIEGYQILMSAIEQVQHHPSLEKIEILKFRGSPKEMELSQHLLRISPSLELCIVNHFYSDLKLEDRIELSRDIEKYRRQAKQLNHWLPPAAKFVIL